MKKKWGIWAVALCLTVSTVGCKQGSDTAGNKNGVKNNTANSEEDPEQCHLDVMQPLAYGNVKGLNLEPGSCISIIGRGSSSEYWSEVREGAESAVDDINEMLGYKGEDKVKLTYSAPESENNVDDQVNILDEELARYPLAVGIAAVDASACEVQFDLAAENNIPIVAFDSGTDYQNIVAMIDTDNAAAAATAANHMCGSMNTEENSEILLLVHDSKSTSAEEREAGFVKAVQEKYPNIKIAATYHLDELEEMQELIAGERAAQSEENDDEEKVEGQEETPEIKGSDITQEGVVQYLLEKHPNVKGIYATNETCSKLAVGVLDTMEKDDISVISFDGGEDQLELLEEGELSGLIVQNPYGIGYATVVACARAILGQGNEAEIDAGYTWVTKENMEDASIKKMMY